MRVCWHSNETRAPIANPPDRAQLEGTPYYSPKLHPGPYSSVGLWRGTDRHSDTQTAVANIHFASIMPDAKCGQRNLTKGRIAAAHGQSSRIRQVALTCTRI